MNPEILKIAEDVTSASTESLQREVQQFIDSGKFNITFDISKVEIVDSSGIGFFIRVQNSLKQKDGTLSLTGLSDDIFSMFKLMRLDQHISIEQ